MKYTLKSTVLDGMYLAANDPKYGRAYSRNPNSALQFDTEEDAKNYMAENNLQAYEVEGQSGECMPDGRV